MWGYTLIGFDGGEVYMSSAEYESWDDAFKRASDHFVDEWGVGDFEVWQDQ